MVNLSSKVFAEEENKVFSFSLSLQKIISDLLGKLKFWKENDDYRQKYYELLREVSELKLNLKSAQENLKDISEFSNVSELKVFKKDPTGLIYASRPKEAKEGDLVVDQNLVLIGFVSSLKSDYMVIKTLFYPGIVFNLGDSEGNFLGTGKTIGNGFIIIDGLTNLSPKLNKNSLVFTYGQDSLFKPNFLVGKITTIEKDANQNFKIVIKLLGVFEEDTFYLYK